MYVVILKYSSIDDVYYGPFSNFGDAAGWAQNYAAECDEIVVVDLHNPDEDD